MKKFINFMERVDAFDTKKIIIFSIVFYIVNLLFFQTIFYPLCQTWLYLIIMVVFGIFGGMLFINALNYDVRVSDRRFKNGYKNNEIRTYLSLKTVTNRSFIGFSLTSLWYINGLVQLVFPISISIAIISFCFNYYLFKKKKINWDSTIATRNVSRDFG